MLLSIFNKGHYWKVHEAQLRFDRIAMRAGIQEHASVARNYVHNAIWIEQLFSIPQREHCSAYLPLFCRLPQPSFIFKIREVIRGVPWDFIRCFEVELNTLFDNVVIPECFEDGAGEIFQPRLICWPKNETKQRATKAKIFLLYWQMPQGTLLISGVPFFRTYFFFRAVAFDRIVFRHYHQLQLSWVPGD